MASAAPPRGPASLALGPGSDARRLGDQFDQHGCDRRRRSRFPVGPARGRPGADHRLIGGVDPRGGSGGAGTLPGPGPFADPPSSAGARSAARGRGGAGDAVRPVALRPLGPLDRPPAAGAAGSRRGAGPDERGDASPGTGVVRPGELDCAMGHLRSRAARGGIVPAGRRIAHRAAGREHRWGRPADARQPRGDAGSGGRGAASLRCGAGARRGSGPRAAGDPGAADPGSRGGSRGMVRPAAADATLRRKRRKRSGRPPRARPARPPRTPASRESERTPSRAARCAT